MKTAYVRRRMVRLAAALGSALLIAAAGAGCEQPPDTSPVVSIVSPVQDQKLQAGKRIDVRFSVGGFDASGPTMVKFALNSGSSKEYGKGRVRAYIDSSQTLAETNVLPNDANPFLVPGPADVPDVTNFQYLAPGKHTIRLILYYNDDTTTKVDPQRSGVVNIVLE